MTNTKSSPFSVDQARELMAAIRAQVFVPEVTTMGPCPRCGESSRGAGVCRNCLGADLDAMTDSMDGTVYVYACEALREAERAVLDEAGGGRK